jgi:hypothetical protein
VCLTCRCTLDDNKEAEVDCIRECPGAVDSTDYVLKEVNDEDACCPRYVRTACKEGLRVYKVFKQNTYKKSDLNKMASYRSVRSGSPRRTLARSINACSKMASWRRNSSILASLFALQ